MRGGDPVDDHCLRRDTARIDAIAVGLSSSRIGVNENLKIRSAHLEAVPLDAQERMPQARAARIGDDESPIGEPSRDLTQGPLGRLFLTSDRRSYGNRFGPSRERVSDRVRWALVLTPEHRGAQRYRDG